MPISRLAKLDINREEIDRLNQNLEEVKEYRMSNFEH